MARQENEPNQPKDQRKRKFTDVITGIFRSKQPVPEVPIEIRRFSDEQRDVLDEQGYLIYELTSKTINVREGYWRGALFDDHNYYNYYDSVREDKNRICIPDTTIDSIGPLTSMRSQVAINLKEPFLKNSNNRTLRQQEIMVEKYLQELGEKLHGINVGAIIGEAADYLELYFQHRDATGFRLFENPPSLGYVIIVEYDHKTARTRTPVGTSSVADVGAFNQRDYQLAIGSYHAMLGRDDLYALPLIVPA